MHANSYTYMHVHTHTYTTHTHTCTYIHYLFLKHLRLVGTVCSRKRNRWCNFHFKFVFLIRDIQTGVEVKKTLCYQNLLLRYRPWSLACRHFDDFWVALFSDVSGHAAGLCLCCTICDVSGHTVGLRYYCLFPSKFNTNLSCRNHQQSEI